MSGQVLTTLEARVPEEAWPLLRAAYHAAANEREPGMLASYLVQASADPGLWRIVSVWRDRETLAAMRGAGTPRGVLIFREAGAEPTLLVGDVVERIEGGA